MRIPDLNVTQSVTQRLKDLNLQRFKLDQQITSGQKITYAEDDGAKMSRTIQLDSQKSRLSQYQRNANYATEFLDAGQMNLEKLREINQRAQEIARIAGGGLTGSGLETYSAEIDQLINEALNRVNSRHRGKSLFGGLELKPDFAHTEVISHKADLKVFDLNNSPVGFVSPDGRRYLKQGDEVVFQANGREYVVQAKLPSVREYSDLDTYNKGDLVKVTQQIDDSILVNSDIYSSVGDLVAKLSQKDWSKEKVGLLHDNSAEVYVLDASQIQQIAVSLGGQPNLDFFPPNGGYFAIVQTEDALFLEPVENKIETWTPNQNYAEGSLVEWGHDIYRAVSDTNSGEVFSMSSWKKVDETVLSETFFLTDNSKISYWEASINDISEEVPSSNGNWKEMNPSEFVSNVSSVEVTSLIRDLINNDSYFLNKSKVYESADFHAFVRRAKSSTDLHNQNLFLSAEVDPEGKLLVTGTVGKPFLASAAYYSNYDSNNYFPEQLETKFLEEAKSMFPGKPYNSLTNEEKNSVWDSVKSEKMMWNLGVSQTETDSNTQLDIKLSEPWRRLGIYQLGDIVEYEGKLWESRKNENFNHDPSRIKSEFWREIGSNYDVAREDWNLTSTGVETRFFFSSADGRLFSDENDAINHNFDILVNSTRNYTDQSNLYEEAKNLVHKIAYPVSRFEAKSSESEGLVFFDSASQTYKLNSLAEGEERVTGMIQKGQAFLSSNDITERGDVILNRGNYFLTLDVLDSETANSALGAEIIQAVDVVGDLTSIVSYGEKIYDEGSGKVYMYLGKTLPMEGHETVLQKGIEQPLRKGSFIYDSAADSYYVAQRDTEDANLVDITDPLSSLIEVRSFVAQQGNEWSVDEIYAKGQIVLHDGIYYECQTDGVADSEGIRSGFNNRLDSEQLGSDGDYFFETVEPSDEFFIAVDDTISEESLGLRRARGENIYNNVWLPISNSVDHVLSFEINNLDAASVKIQSAGGAGNDAKVKVMSDVNGVVNGLQVVDPGRYFFAGARDEQGNVNIPEDYQFAEVVLPNGDYIKANIIWGENPNDPGPFVISGFELLNSAVLDKPSGASVGDSFSFATGRKTFLDHRDEDGKLIGVSYTGSNKDAEFYVGQDSKLSSFLKAEDNGTKELSNVLNALVNLQRGLLSSDHSEMIQSVQLAEQDLIVQEDSVVDKIGELSSAMVRMNTVRSHDEEYFIEIDQRLAKDLDVDLSEAIMQLTRVSTAYQAAMQVGAQLLNTSLLNYL